MLCQLDSTTIRPLHGPSPPCSVQNNTKKPWSQTSVLLSSITRCRAEEFSKQKKPPPTPHQPVLRKNCPSLNFGESNGSLCGSHNSKVINDERDVKKPVSVRRSDGLQQAVGVITIFGRHEIAKMSQLEALRYYPGPPPVFSTLP